MGGTRLCFLFTGFLAGTALLDTLRCVSNISFGKWAAVVHFLGRRLLLITAIGDAGWWTA